MFRFIIIFFLSTIWFGCLTTNVNGLQSNSEQTPTVKTVTPEDVINDWLTYAKEQNWEAMANIAQITWKSKKGSSAAEEISWNYDFFDIESWKIISTLKKSETFYTVKVEIQTQLGTKTMEANVIKERGPYEQSIYGKWGVNPISAMFHQNK